MTCRKFGTKLVQNDQGKVFLGIFGKANPSHARLRVRQVLKVVIPGIVRVREEVVGGGLFDTLVLANP